MSHSTPPQSRTMILGIISAVLVLSGLVAALIWHGDDPSTLIGFAATSLLPVVILLFNLKRTEQVAQDVDTVRRQTNGPISRIAAQVADLHSAATNDGDGRHSRGGVDGPPQ